MEKHASYKNLFLKKAKIIYKQIHRILLFLSKIFRNAALFFQNLPRRVGLNISYKIIPMKDASNCTIIHKEVDKNEILYFPKIYQLTDGGEITVKTNGINIYELSAASFVMGSDFIRFNDGTVSCDKLLRKEYEFARPADADLAELNFPNCKLKKYPKKREFDNVFHISGPYFKHWGHFLMQFYPKLDFITKIPNDKIVNILIPAEIDPHIKFMIENAVKKYDHINIVEIERNEEIFCKVLYYPQIDTYIGDIGTIGTMFHIQTSDSTVRYLKSSTRNLLPIEANQYRKLYIGRDGSRSIINEDEVFKRFKKIGFEKVFPHKLDIYEKIKIFAEAKFIVGPGSSGFSNLIFCQKKTKILLFINSGRHDDMYLTKYSKINEMDFIIFTGRQVDLSDFNSSYTVDLNALDKFILESQLFNCDL